MLTAGVTRACFVDVVFPGISPFFCVLSSWGKRSFGTTSASSVVTAEVSPTAANSCSTAGPSGASEYQTLRSLLAATTVVLYHNAWLITRFSLWYWAMCLRRLTNWCKHRKGNAGLAAVILQHSRTRLRERSLRAIETSCLVRPQGYCPTLLHAVDTVCFLHIDKATCSR